MKQLFILTIFFLETGISFGQRLVKIGDKAPKYYFNKILNAQNTELDVSDLKGKTILIAFWGTWCPPCITEMVNLGKLQNKFGDRVQIIGVSRDNEQKLKAFLVKRPSKIWFASDPTNNLWNIFDLETAGYTVLIDKDYKVVGVTETKKIDSTVISHLIFTNQVNLEEDRGSKKLGENQDPVKLDSTTLYSFVLQPALKGILPELKYPRTGTFGNRRIKMINLVPEVILRDAFDISIPAKVIYSSKDDSLKSKENSFCVDFIVPDSDKHNLKTLFQNELNSHLPVKGKIQKKIIPCYILRPIEGKQILIKESTKSENEFFSNSLEFDGEGILFSSFIGYLEDKLNYPVYDATGLTKYYDLDFVRNNIEPLKSTKESLAKLGLELVKDQREMEVLVISARL